MFGIARSAGCNSNAGYRQRYGDKPITVGWLGGRNRKELRCRECVMRRDRARWPVGIALAVAASVGNLMICQNRARSLADLIAFDAAYALWHADIGDPCALAANMAEANGVVLGSCSVRDEDVLVTIKVETMVLVASSVERMARAGPVSCTEGDNYHNNGP